MKYSRVLFRGIGSRPAHRFRGPQDGVVFAETVGHGDEFRTREARILKIESVSEFSSS